MIFILISIHHSGEGRQNSKKIFLRKHGPQFLTHLLPTLALRERNNYVHILSFNSALNRLDANITDIQMDFSTNMIECTVFYKNKHFLVKSSYRDTATSIRQKYYRGRAT